MRILAAFDKFRGSLTAAEACRAACRGSLGHVCEARPIADGGEGLVDAFGGPNRSATVTGPLGDPVKAGWRLDGDRAVIEMARASGLALIDGPNDPVRATTRGTGELIAAALAEGARRLIVGVGGSATTDGGHGAIEVLPERFEVEVVVACDVTTRFVDAARLFGPQKGADPDTVERLTERLEGLARRWRDETGIDVRDLVGAGAAGGLAGGLATRGATLRSGFDVVAEEVGLAEMVEASDLVLTGEGRFDATSMLGKATGGVVRLAGRHGVEVVVVAGTVDRPLPPDLHVIGLADVFGSETAWADPAGCLERSVHRLLDGR